MNGRSAAQSRTIFTAQASTSSVVRASATQAFRSRSAPARRSARALAVVSVTGWNKPAIWPVSSLIGLSEKVKNVSSRYPFRRRNIRWFSRKDVSPPSARSNGAPIAGQADAQVLV